MKEIYISQSITEQQLNNVERYLNYLRDTDDHWKDRQFKLIPAKYTSVIRKQDLHDLELERALRLMTKESGTKR